MPALLHLQVPKSAWPDIEALLALPSETVYQLCQCLENAPALPDLEDLAEHCSELVPVLVPQTVSVLTLLINLKRLQRSFADSAEDVIDAFEQALERAKFPGWESGQKEAWKDRRELLVPILSSENAIATMGKVRMLLFESQCTLQESMILTDVRHVYNEAGTEILGGMVLQTLSLSFTEGGDSRQIHIMMTADDVAKLIAQLKRDQRKAETATELLSKQGLMELTPKRNIQL